MIEQLIHARTQELNRINAGWDEKIGVVLSAEVKPEALEQLSRQAPRGLLSASLDQRASESGREDVGPSFASSVFGDSRKHRAPSQ